MSRNTKFRYLILLAVTAVFTLILSPIPVQADDDNWLARYWNNTTMSGNPVLQRSEGEINHLWGDGSPSGVNPGNFSARWTRTIYFETGSYRFTATMDDGMRVWKCDSVQGQSQCASPFYGLHPPGSENPPSTHSHNSLHSNW